MGQIADTAIDYMQSIIVVCIPYLCLMYCISVRECVRGCVWVYVHVSESVCEGV